MLRYITILLALCIPAVASAQATKAQNKKSDSTKVYTLPSVTVTTTKARRDSTPVPFSEIERAEIARHYTYQDLPALLGSLPNTLFVSQNGNSVGYTDLSIRGFGQRRIAVMINGVPQNDPEDHNVYWIDFPDLASNLESIQVQRGAGLASYGPAAIGGSVNLTTTNFTNERSIKLSAGIGVQEYGAGGSSTFQRNLDKLALEVSSGLVDNYAFYGRVSRIKSDGYRDLSYTTLNSFFLSGVRYDENLTSQINVFGGPLEDGLAYIGLPKSYVENPDLRRKNYGDWYQDSTGQVDATLRRSTERENFSQPHFELLNDWYINENLTIKSALFYYTGDGFFDYLDPWADASVLQVTPENDFPEGVNISNAIVRADVSNRHGGWLPRLEWKRENATLTAGAEFRLHRSNHWGKILHADGLPDDYDPDYKFYEYDGERDIFSVFAREQRKLSESLVLDVQAQLVYHSYRINNEKMGKSFTEYATTDGGKVGGGDELFNVSYVFLNPRVGLMAHLSDANSVYGSVAYTQREPRMKNLYDASFGYYGSRPLFAAEEVDGVRRYNFDEPLVDPEKLLNLELGWNYTSEPLRLNVNLYWMEFFDELVSNGQLDRFGAPIDGNAPRTRHIGAELEGTARLYHSQEGGSVIVQANAAVSKNTIIEYDYFSGGETISLEDNPIGGFPEFIANLRLIYTRGDFYGGISARHVGEFYTDNFKDENNKNDAYTVLNADFLYRLRELLGFRSIGLRAQVNNLLNALYSSGGEGRQFFPAAERNYFFGIEFEL